MIAPAKGIGGLVFVLLFVAIVLVYIPATRWFLLFSVPIGLLFAFVLSWWHKRRPIKQEVNKRPLGL